MPARAIGTVTVSFGLVTIPVKLYSTNIPSSSISFNLLHSKCKSRLKQQYICPTDANEIVERDDMVKGYEFAKGQYVTFTDEELKALEQQKSEAIDITEFVPADKVDPVYFDKAYYLGPDKGGEKAYRLLAEAMKRTGRSALATYAARGKQYLVLVRPHGDEGLVMQQLRYADEVKSFAEVPVGDGIALKEPELKLAMQLIEQIANDEFRPDQYTDDVKVRIQQQIQRKVEGQEVTAAAPEAPQAQIIDLMEALKASLAAKPAAPVKPAAADKDLERKPAKKSGGRASAASSKKAAK
jgi:DNA end-binding protein Ku